jgi:hypothetical protein
MLVPYQLPQSGILIISQMVCERQKKKKKEKTKVKASSTALSLCN